MKDEYYKRNKKSILMKLIYGSFLNYYHWKKKKYMKEILGFRDLKVEIGGHFIYFLEKNPEKKNSILLIHGLLDSATGLRKVAPKIREDYRVLIPDIPGFGKSKLPNLKYLYQVNVFADLIYESIRKLNLTNTVLGGHSMGALISMHIALKDSEKRISKLVLMAPGGIPHPKRDEMKELLFPKTEEDLLKLIEALYYETPTLPGKIARKALIQSWNELPNQFLTVNTIEREEEIFLGKKLSAIQIPALILSGKEDPITDTTMIKKLHSYLKRSKLVLIPGAKHAIHMEKSDELSLEINRYLD
ncbi:alpha/beta fold hydrolase [Leptospira interrogans]|uniref:Hydrolase n=3 Tax=Leptospira interrogans TaxID=173 RepID=Q72MS9_LEPIC|nr:hydrolase [Leptospira interrogans serovar Copenhageni str. Fiocruz L1-130]ARB95761.1 alpha/beta hydrolase [Leptospira interrogans serovar Copenhageni]EKO88210.1 alpha/beta hydrolase family protein [Leptospira interrogans serovar Grippotyphosa str. Andaman]EKP76707.1 alpha/beta hydrolase family protein [Leptospira interrogans str. HAI1594]EKP87805.1 alpha/beta hydrolase family protein [Leptospira interrogans serovar Grippotyphosa str. 2006006986]EKR43620.1 alpha/beta hydrolase family protein